MRPGYLALVFTGACWNDPAFDAHQTPLTVRPEVAVDVPIVATTGWNASDPAIAFDGTNYLVVWADARDDANSDIWGARLDQSGAILDPTGIKIAATAGIQAHPAIAFDGSRFLIVWEDFKIAKGTESDIAAAAVSTTGVVTPLAAVATTTASETTPSISANGSGVLVTWIANNQVMGAVFNGSFGAPFAVTSGANVRRDPAVAAAPAGDYLVVFTEANPTTDDDTRGQLVASNGALDGPAFDISNGNVATRNPAVAFDGTNFDVVWSSYYLGVDIYGTRVSQTGAVLDVHLEGSRTIGGKIVNNAANYQEVPSIACSSAGCLVSWQDKRNLSSTGYDIYGQLLTTGFAPSGTDFVISSAPLTQFQARVVAASGNYFEVWRDARAGGNAALKIGGTRINGSGGVIDLNGIVVNPGNNSEQGPALAVSGSTIAVGWNDSRSLWGDDIEMARFDFFGSALDVSPSTISSAQYAQVESAIAGFGSTFIYAWSDNRSGAATDVYVGRINAGTGAVIDPAGILVSVSSPGQNVSPQVASSGAEALVVWENAIGPDENILGAIVSATGGASAPFVICNATSEQGRPAVSYNASAGQYVVVWMDSRAANPDIYGARVTPTGVVLDPIGVLVATGTSKRLSPKIATAGATMLAVYEDYRNGNWDIYGTRLTAGAALTVLDPAGIAITTDPAHQVSPTVTSLGTDFFVGWSDERAGSSTSHDIWGQFVSSTGSLTDGNFAVTAGADDETSVVSLGVDSSHLQLGYLRHRPDLDATRLVTRMIDATPTLLSIVVTPIDPTIAKNAHEQFTATGTYSDGTSQNITTQVTWTSSHQAVATIASSGVATGLYQGTTTITATLGVLSGSTTLTVISCHHEDDRDD